MIIQIMEVWPTTTKINVTESRIPYQYDGLDWRHQKNLQIGMMNIGQANPSINYVTKATEAEEKQQQKSSLKLRKNYQ